MLVFFLKSPFLAYITTLEAITKLSYQSQKKSLAQGKIRYGSRSRFAVSCCSDHLVALVRGARAEGSVGEAVLSLRLRGTFAVTATQYSQALVILSTAEITRFKNVWEISQNIDFPGCEKFELAEKIQKHTNVFVPVVWSGYSLSRGSIFNR